MQSRMTLNAVFSLFLIGGDIHAANATAYTYTPFNYPGSIVTAPWDINDSGYVVGEYAPVRGVGKAFVYDGASFEEILIPGATFSRARGLNNSGTIVGEYRASDNSLHGFIYSSGAVTTYDVAIPGATRTVLTGINNNGVLIGEYDDRSGNLIGFIDDGGVITTINYGSGSTFTSGINDLNQIVGVYRPGTSSNRGYLYESGIFNTVPPVNLQSQARDINNAGKIVGDYYNPGRRGFLLDGTVLIDFYYPDASAATYLLGLNDMGDVVGAYSDSSLGFSRSLGFIATPVVVPEPGAMPLFVTGVVLLSVCVWRRQKSLTGRSLGRSLRYAWFTPHSLVVRRI